MNVNEYGVKFRIGLGFNITGYSALQLDFIKPDETTLTINTGIAPGASTIVTPLGTFAAGTWAEYVFLQDQVDQEGVWTVRLTYDDLSGQHLISDIATFTVNP